LWLYHSFQQFQASVVKIVLVASWTVIFVQQLLNLLACCFCMLSDVPRSAFEFAVCSDLYVLVPTPLSFASDLVDTRFSVLRNDGHLRRLEAVFQFVHIAALYHSDVMVLEIFAYIFGKFWMVGNRNCSRENFLMF
jgi:hypothetical protein